MEADTQQTVGRGATDRKEGGVTVLVHDNKEEEKPSSQLERESVQLLSAAHCTAGSLVIITQVLINLMKNADYDVTTLNEGIFAGGFYIISGFVGFMLLRRTNRLRTTLFLAFNLLAFLWSLILLVFACSMLKDLNYFKEMSSSYDFFDSTHCGLVVLSVLQLLLSILQGTVSLSSVSLCARVICCTTLSKNVVRFPALSIKIMSIIQIGIGLFFIIFYILNYFIVVTFSYYEEILCGLLFILIGAVGLLTIRGATTYLATPFTIINVMGSVFCVALLIFTAVKTNDANRKHDSQLDALRDNLQWAQSPDYDCKELTLVASEEYKEMSTKNLARIKESALNPDLIDEIRRCEKDKTERIRRIQYSIDNSHEYTKHHNIKISILTVQIILVITELVLTIICAAISGRVSCCGSAVALTAGYIPAVQTPNAPPVIQITKIDGASDGAQINQSPERREYRI